MAPIGSLSTDRNTNCRPSAACSWSAVVCRPPLNLEGRNFSGVRLKYNKGTCTGCTQLLRYKWPKNFNFKPLAAYWGPAITVALLPLVVTSSVVIGAGISSLMQGPTCLFTGIAL